MLWFSSAANDDRKPPTNKSNGKIILLSKTKEKRHWANIWTTTCIVYARSDFFCFVLLGVECLCKFSVVISPVWVFCYKVAPQCCCFHMCAPPDSIFAKRVELGRRNIRQPTMLRNKHTQTNHSRTAPSLHLIEFPAIAPSFSTSHPAKPKNDVFSLCL